MLVTARSKIAGSDDTDQIQGMFVAGAVVDAYGVHAGAQCALFPQNE